MVCRRVCDDRGGGAGLDCGEVAEVEPLLVDGVGTDRGSGSDFLAVVQVAGRQLAGVS